MKKTTPDAPEAPVTLRRATRADCRRLWEWRNEETTRRASFDARMIAYGEHERWFTRRLADPSSRIFIVAESGGRDVGYVRFQIAGQEAEISVSIDREARRRRYGTRAILAASRHMLTAEPIRRVVARVRVDNPTSLAVFGRAGFVVRRDGEVRGANAWEMVFEAGSALDDQGGASPILFRVNADAGAGLGHLQRSLSLAAAFRRLGVTSLFVASAAPAGLARITRAGFPVEALDGAEPWRGRDLERLLTVTAGRRCAVVVVDSDDVDPGYLRGLRAAGLVTVVVDDSATHPFPCDLVVNGDAHAGKLAYRSPDGSPRLLLGPEYAILREELWAVNPPAPRSVVRDILVTMGGGDPLDLTPALVAMLDDLAGDFTVTVVVGPFSRSADEAARAAARSRRKVGLIRAPDTLVPAMLAADLAISAGGQTLYELARLGRPAIAIAAAANQVAQLRALAAAGTVVPIAFTGGQDVTARTASACAGLLADSATRARMSGAGTRLVDGAGALRVARAILAALEEERASRASSPGERQDGSAQHEGDSR